MPADSPPARELVTNSGKDVSLSPARAAQIFPTLKPLGERAAAGDAAETDGDVLPPLSRDQLRVAAVWSAVLGRPLPGLRARDSFFDLGGSLQFVQIARGLTDARDAAERERAGGDDIAVSQLLGDPTLAGMTTLAFGADGAAAIDGSTGGDGATAWDADAEAAHFWPIQSEAEHDNSGGGDTRATAAVGGGGPLDKSTARLVATTAGELLTAYHAETEVAAPRARRVLVTGATGWVAAYIVRELCGATPLDVEPHLAIALPRCAERRGDASGVARVECLVRARDAAGAAARLRALCEKRGLLPRRADDDITPDWFDERVTCVAGDVAKPHFGLELDEYDALIARVDVVVHAAAEVNMLKPYGALAATNVGGTREVLAFCKRARAPHVFTSTLLPLPGEEPTGYRLSKEVAERLIHRAARPPGSDGGGAGVPSCVLQLGDIGLSASRGAPLPEDDYILIVLRSCLALALWPSDAPWAISVMSVDQCARLIANLAVTAPERDFIGETPAPLAGESLRVPPVLIVWRACPLALPCRRAGARQGRPRVVE